MSAWQEGNSYIVEAEVAGHSVYNGKPTTQLNIPAWRGKFPTTLYNVEPEIQDVLPIGETVAVELVADKLKDDKAGDKPWDYFWSFVRRADLSEVTAQPQARPQGGGAPGPDAVPRTHAGSGDRDPACRRPQGGGQIHGPGGGWDGRPVSRYRGCVRSLAPGG